MHVEKTATSTITCLTLSIQPALLLFEGYCNM